MEVAAWMGVDAVATRCSVATGTHTMISLRQT